MSDRTLQFSMWKSQRSPQDSAVSYPHHDHRPWVIPQSHFLRHPGDYKAKSAENGSLLNIFSSFGVSGPCLLFVVPKSFLVHSVVLSPDSVTSSCFGSRHHLYSQARRLNKKSKESRSHPTVVFSEVAKFFLLIEDFEAMGL